MPAIWQKDNYTIAAGENVNKGTRFCLEFTFDHEVELNEETKELIRKLFAEELEASIEELQ